MSQEQVDFYKSISQHLPTTLELEQLFDQLWPITRSLTGPGYRSSLNILKKIAPFKTLEFPSGSKAFDWTVPPEWHIEEAYIIGPDGKRFCDLRQNNLHVLNFSAPVECELSLEELQKHLYSLPEIPEAIPYLTSYYQRRWGFCIRHSERLKLQPGNYKCIIKSKFIDGNLEVGEATLSSNSDSKKEILFSSYLCHPSMANNELSGPIVLSYLHKIISHLPQRKFNYRFVCVPETIGSICFLSQRGSTLKELCHAGYVITCCGDRGSFTYKKSRRGNTVADRAAQEILKSEENVKMVEFFPSGSDERQYCSPHFNLPVGSLMRTMYGTNKEYHTSLDNKDFISFEHLKETILAYLKIVLALEANETYIRTEPGCEPMLSKHGLYPTLGSQKENDLVVDQLLWLLNLCDGENDLLEIARISGYSILDLNNQIIKLEKCGLIKKLEK